MKPVLLTLSLLYCGCASAAQWSEEVSVTFVMGDLDSRVRVREAGIEEMRRIAANKVGKIVESSTRSDGKTINEEMRVVGVSLVKVSDIKEGVVIDGAGKIAVTITGVVSVDESELEKRAAVMRADQDKARVIRQLAQENERLRKSLLRVGDLLRSGTNASQGGELLKRHSELLESLRGNASQVNARFEKGHILTLAEEDAANWTRFQMDIDEQMFFRAIEEGLVKVAVDRVEKQMDGAVKVFIKVGWQIDSSWFEAGMDGRSPRIESNRFVYWGHLLDEGKVRMALAKESDFVFIKFNYARRFFEYMSNNMLALDVAIGKSNLSIPVIFMGNDGCRVVSKDDITRCLRGVEFGGRVDEYNKTFGMISKDFDATLLQPFVINASKEDAANAVEISAVWRFKSKGKADRVYQVKRI